MDKVSTILVETGSMVEKEMLEDTTVLNAIVVGCQTGRRVQSPFSVQCYDCGQTGNYAGQCLKAERGVGRTNIG